MMFVLSLISTPSSPLLEHGKVAAVTRHLMLENADVSWLAKGLACDIKLAYERRHDALQIQARAREFLAGDAIDVNVIKTDNRRKKLLIADMDSTIIEQECIDELGDVAGAGEAIQEVTRRAMRGELDFVEALHGRVSHMKGLPESAIAHVIDERITFVDGGRTLVQTMKAGGAYCALVSGGFKQFTAHVSRQCGFDTHQANELVIENGHLTGAVIEPALGGAAKIEALNRLAGELKLSVDEAITVGDGANDIGMLERAGLGVAMHAKPVVRDAADTVIDHGDLTAPLYLQGYHRDEFVT